MICLRYNMTMMDESLRYADQTEQCGVVNNQEQVA